MRFGISSVAFHFNMECQKIVASVWQVSVFMQALDCKEITEIAFLGLHCPEMGTCASVT